ncbi:MAG TPA: ChbG/HpnK family deacetylase, partial [Thermoanaerobaculia bacterium]|nr:ChbG/HpnK family deacetylase [Thermoanaerobaculia bacterium]
LGLLAAGRLDARRLEALLGDVRGTCELVCHPGLGREALARRYDWGYSWEGETAALTDPALAARLRQRSIEVLSFSRLAG